MRRLSCVAAPRAGRLLCLLFVRLRQVSAYAAGTRRLRWGIMNIRQLKELCGSLSGANKTLYGAPSNFLVYSVGGQKFAYFKTSDPERWRFSTRVTPDRFVELTDFPGVKPARYRGRFHWVTIVEVSRFPASYLTELVEWSYHTAFASLSKARQNAIRASCT